MRGEDAARADTADLAGCLRAFEAESEFVLRALRRQGVRPHDVEDLAQDVFVVLYRRWSDLDHDRPLRPWLSGVIVKVAQRYRRREGRFVPAGVVDQEDTGRATDDWLGGLRARALISRALAQLTERQRAVVVLHDLDGVPMREIASRLEVPLFTAYTRLRDGRRSLAAAVQGLPSGKTRARKSVASLWRLAAAAAIVAGLGAAITLTGRSGAAALSAPQPPALARGLVGYWPFDDGGPVAVDRSGGGNDCVLRSTDGGPHGRTVEGVAGSGLELDGKGWLECPRAERLAGLETELTIALWVRTPGDGVGSRQALVTRQLDESGDRLFSLRFQRQRLEFLSHVWKTLLGKPFAGRGWTHVAAVRDATGTQLYLDGALVGRTGRSTPGSLGGGRAALLIGGQVNGPEPGPAQDRFQGSIDELRIYDRALPAADIAALARPAR